MGFIKKLIRLNIGLLLFSVGIVMMINADMGLSPWDVLHQGISRQTPLTMGQASILVGLGIVAFNFIFHEKVGMGTILNMFVIGLFMDFLMINDIIPQPGHLALRLLLLISGMVVIAVASWLYIGAGLGAGPRDGLMVALHKRTGKSVRFVRNSIEISVLIVGFFLGGSVGPGTVITSVGQGFIIQFVFKLLNFNVRSVSHRYIDDTVRSLFERS